MVLAAHYFWSHITWSAASIFLIFGVPNSCYSKVSYPQISIVIKDDIFRLDVSVDNAVLVAVLKPKDDIGSEELGLQLSKPPMFTDVVPQVPSAKVVHDQVQIMPVLKSVFHVHNIVIMKLG
eukprot:CAMPEP_0196996562 /NCGR_PEP_ID=MMETSP1380-20130617/2414_1 /TAXON_ID=5936 /ORGANISM="Euplotes crassus, Strain CT5" /LENGTH=121 /DNA_ID=CAMNT_0042412575 /DNA_START=933 /DNA_END=1298 /DNA_ORIENTATION=+